MSRITCACGYQAPYIRYINGKKTCDKCTPQARSGTFLRKMEGEVREYQRDVLQKYNKDGSLNEDFKEVYGEGRNA